MDSGNQSLEGGGIGAPGEELRIKLFLGLFAGLVLPGFLRQQVFIILAVIRKLVLFSKLGNRFRGQDFEIFHGGRLGDGGAGLGVGLAGGLGGVGCVHCVAPSLIVFWKRNGSVLDTLSSLKRVATAFVLHSVVYVALINSFVIREYTPSSCAL